jgi:replication factor A2
LKKGKVTRKMSGGYSDYGDYADGGGGGYGGGGGGYSDHQGGGGGGFSKSGGFNSSGTPDKKGGGREQTVQTTTPLTLKMIVDAPQNPQDDSIKIDGKQVSKVVVYGRVLSVQTKTTYIEYVLDDGSELITVVKNLPTDDSPAASFGNDFISERTYVCVHGAVRSYDGPRKILCHFIRPVQDHNELTCHFLSVIFTHYQNLKGPLHTAGSNAVSTSYPGSTSFNQVGGNFNQALSSGGNDNSSGLDRDSRLVHDAFARDNATDTGYSVMVVADMLKGQGFNLAKVKNICQSLMADGFIYSTVDDDHFKSTGSMI